jgi:Xaa-Pro dipeptidase
MSFDLNGMQADLRAAKLDGWLFYDFRGRDPIAQRILQLPPSMRTRRWFYFVPAKGAPRKLVHKIESQSLAALPGTALQYAAQDELQEQIAKTLGPARIIAMESHLAAGKSVDRIVQGAFRRAAQSVRDRSGLTEYDLQQWIRSEFEAADLVTDEGPDVAVGPHSGDPHYGPAREGSSPIREGDLLLLDVWGKLKTPRGVYYDVTWIGYLGATVPAKYAKVFAIVREARDRAVDLIQTSIAAGKPLQGWRVDKAARDVIDKAGYGKYFFHRTGHNIGESIHGNGVNMDGLETRDVRHLIPGTCNSIEPGIYLKDFGIRSEVDVYVGEREAQVTGAVQKEILALLA